MERTTDVGRGRKTGAGLPHGDYEVILDETNLISLQKGRKFAAYMTLQLALSVMGGRGGAERGRGTCTPTPRTLDRWEVSNIFLNGSVSTYCRV